jgi:anti-anti-sigma factor
MKITIREKEGVAILDLEGNIDINASNFVEEVGWVLKNKTKDIICNFEGVNLVDYVGISLIAVVYKNVLNHNGRVNLYNIPSHVMKLFSLVGLNRIFECYATEEQALNGLRESKIISQLLKKRLRRKFKRVPLNLEIEYKQKFSSADPSHKGKILNLSGDGVFMLADKTFSIGDVLSVRISLVPEPGLLELEAKVVWLADKEIQPRDFPGMGLEFKNVTPEVQEKIIQFVEKHLTHSAQD